MKYCNSCNTALEDDATFCYECGTSQGGKDLSPFPETTTTQQTFNNKSIPILSTIAIIVIGIIIGLNSVSHNSEIDYSSGNGYTNYEYQNNFATDVQESTTANDSYESYLAEIIATNQIKKQTFAKDETVYDVEVVESDGNGRYIVTATTKPNAFENWWAVYVEIFDDNDTYTVAANYHGDGVTVSEWINRYKTLPEYSWGGPRPKAN